MIKNIVSNILQHLHLPFIRKYFEGMITIFMLHRVHPIDHSRLFPNENMKVSPEFLERFIKEAKLKGYEFISLDRVYEILTKGEEVEKQLVITLDDGYLDNYTYAYPIFKKYNVPFTIYVTTSFPQGEAILWWYVLEDLILENDFIKLSNGMVFECKTKEQKEKVFLKIREIILKINQKHLLKSLNDLFENYKIDWLSKNKELCLSWDHIIELSRDELCTIGGHTKNHLVLSQLSEEEVIQEIIDGNRLLEERIGKKVEHFAYPFGTRKEVGPREFNIVKSLNIKTATTTRRGSIHKEHKNFLECLPRIMLVENFNINFIGAVRRQVFIDYMKKIFAL